MLFNRRTLLAAAAAQALVSAQRSEVELGAISGQRQPDEMDAGRVPRLPQKIGLRHAMISLPREVLLDESALDESASTPTDSTSPLILAHGSVCPSSRAFNANLGTVEEQVAPALRASQIFGARSMRCVLGSGTERPGDRPAYREHAASSPRHALSHPGFRRQTRRGEPWRRPSGPRAQGARRGGGPRYSRRLSGFRQSRLDARRSAYDAGDAGPTRNRPTSGTAPCGACPKESPCDGSTWAMAMSISTAGSGSSSPCVPACR